MGLFYFQERERKDHVFKNQTMARPGFTWMDLPA